MAAAVFVYSSSKSSDLNVSPYPITLWHTCLFKAVSQALGCAHQVLQDQGVAHSAQTDELQTALKIQVSLSTMLAADSSYFMVPMQVVMVGTRYSRKLPLGLHCARS